MAKKRIIKKKFYTQKELQSIIDKSSLTQTEKASILLRKYSDFKSAEGINNDKAQNTKEEFNFMKRNIFIWFTNSYLNKKSDKVINLSNASKVKIEKFKNTLISKIQGKYIKSTNTIVRTNVTVV